MMCAVLPQFFVHTCLRSACNVPSRSLNVILRSAFGGSDDDMSMMLMTMMFLLFQWYCRFYMGRRSEDDERQIGEAQRSLMPCIVLRCPTHVGSRGEVACVVHFAPLPAHDMLIMTR
jgi:hypothetical protein